MSLNKVFISGGSIVVTALNPGNRRAASGIVLAATTFPLSIQSKFLRGSDFMIM